jgi:hypothetical protein
MKIAIGIGVVGWLIIAAGILAGLFFVFTLEAWVYGIASVLSATFCGLVLVGISEIIDVLYNKRGAS